MIRYLISLFFAIAFLFCLEFSTAQDNFNNNVKKSLELNVIIETYNNGSSINSGAGIIVGRTKNEIIIASAYHIFKKDDWDKIEVSFNSQDNKSSVEATPIDFQNNRGFGDLVILSAKISPHLKRDPCVFKLNQLGETNDLGVHDEVFPIGTLEKRSFVHQRTDRIIDINDTIISFQTEFMSIGFSGGGLLDKNGYLVGMLIRHGPPVGKAYNLSSIMELVRESDSIMYLDYALPNGRTPLHKAIMDKDFGAVKHILDDCPNINAIDDSGATALHYATINDDYSLIIDLLSYGANPNIQNSKKRFPIDFAIDNSCFKCVEVLVENNARLDLPRFVENAITNGNVEIIKYLINAGADVSSPYLVRKAIIRGNLEVLGLLASQEINLAVIDNESLPIHLAIEFEKTEVVEYLIKYAKSNSIEIDIPDVEGRTPMNLAALKDNTHIIEILLTENQFNLDTYDYSEMTPLNYTIKNNNYEASKLLLERGAKLDAHNKNKERALYQAIRNKSPELTKLLLDYGENPNGVRRNNIHGETPPLYLAIHQCEECAFVLLDNGAGRSHVDEWNISIMNAGLKSGNVEIIVKLIEKDFLFGMDESNKSKFVERCLLLNNPKILRSLRIKGFNINK